MSTSVRTAKPRWFFSSFLIFAALFGPLGRVEAGGVDFGPDDKPANNGPVYLGVATDQSGNPVPDAKVTVHVATPNTTVVQHADSQGHFFIKAFDKSINPKDVDITCSKDGYLNAEATKNITSDPTAPVETVCLLHKN